jgi:hypothetical protein
VATLLFNIAKGRVHEFARRAADNDPTNAGFKFLWLETAGLESDATLIDKDTVTDLLSGSTNEQTNLARVTTVSGGTITIDDTNDRVDLKVASIGSPLYTGLSGNAVSKLVLAYDPNISSPNDAVSIPILMMDWVFTPNGTNVWLDVSTSHFLRIQ